MGEKVETESNLSKELFLIDSSVSLDKMKLLLEQYKIYVETMEKLVARRQTSHSIFLTANASLITVAAFALKNLESPTSLISLGAIFAVASAGIMLDLTWRRLSKHYGLMNRVKFEVIHALERQLPAAVFSAEWKVLEKEQYQSMAKIEATIPQIFIAFYLILVLVAVLIRVYQ
ncbi:MAG: hypothetical protein F6K21_34265 [Symploca sp. SIO2D2]|nr:hypothetical protein [Symploca sp. SIO2D2]NER24365.1 hypothetical protein [Symploca sp. SIO1C2]